MHLEYIWIELESYWNDLEWFGMVWIRFRCRKIIEIEFEMVWFGNIMLSDAFRIYLNRIGIVLEWFGMVWNGLDSISMQENNFNLVEFKIIFDWIWFVCKNLVRFHFNIVYLCRTINWNDTYTIFYSKSANC